MVAFCVFICVSVKERKKERKDDSGFVSCCIEREKRRKQTSCQVRCPISKLTKERKKEGKNEIMKERTEGEISDAFCWNLKERKKN